MQEVIRIINELLLTVGMEPVAFVIACTALAIAFASLGYREAELIRGQIAHKHGEQAIYGIVVQGFFILAAAGLSLVTLVYAYQMSTPAYLFALIAMAGYVAYIARELGSLMQLAPLGVASLIVACQFLPLIQY